MGLRNTPAHYGGLTKFFHWMVFALFVYQYVVANIMLRIGSGSLGMGIDQDVLYNWHKSIGLVVLIVALFRIVWRKTNRLPDWAPTLSEFERSLVHRVENVLYTCMFVMPITGYLYVMAGGYGVLLFGRTPLPNPMGKVEWLAVASQWGHRITGWVIVIALVVHIGLVLRHQLILKDGLLKRMLPFTGRG